MGFELIGLCLMALIFVISPLLLTRLKRDEDAGEDVDRQEVIRQLALQRQQELQSLDGDPAKPAADAASDGSELQQELNSVLLREYEAAQTTVDSQNSTLGSDTMESGTTATKANRSLVFVLLVPALAWLIYLTVADPGLTAIQGAEEVLRLDAQAQGPEITRWQEKLSQRVASEPEDSKSLYLLGHAELKLGNYAAAADVFERTLDAAGEDLTVQVYWLQSRYLASQGVLDEESRALADKILQQQPGNPVVLEILALHAFTQNDKPQAIALLNRAISGTNDPVRQASFGRAIEQIRASMEAPSNGVQVNVSLAQADVSQLPHTSALFVIARPVGGGMPYAVVRRPALLLPIQTYLDDMVSMSPDRKLSQAEAFEVAVRISMSGQAMPQAGDWQWVSEPLSLVNKQAPADETDPDSPSPAPLSLQVVLSPPASE